MHSIVQHHRQVSRHREIEPNFYEVNGTPKRFFDETAVRALFANGWHIRAIEHIVTRKYVLAKALWEVIVERERSIEGRSASTHSRTDWERLENAGTAGIPSTEHPEAEVNHVVRGIVRRGLKQQDS